MTHYVGLDASMKETNFTYLMKGAIGFGEADATESVAIAAAVRRLAPTAIRIGLADSSKRTFAP